MNNKPPVPPSAPPNRIELLTLFGVLRFHTLEECSQFQAEPLWRRVFHRTAYHERLRQAGRK